MSGPSTVRYGEARRGKLWREALFARYGKNRWYLNIDADEYLVYDRCFEKPLPDLIAQLERLRASTVRCADDRHVSRRQR